MFVIGVSKSLSVTGKCTKAVYNQPCLFPCSVGQQVNYTGYYPLHWYTVLIMCIHHFMIKNAHCYLFSTICLILSLSADFYWIIVHKIHLLSHATVLLGLIVTEYSEKCTLDLAEISPTRVQTTIQLLPQLIFQMGTQKADETAVLNYNVTRQMTSQTLVNPREKYK